MIVGIVKEKAGESRVSLLPEQADALLKRKVNILIEKGAGEQAYASDGAYEAKNIKAAGRDEVLKNSDVLLSIHPLSTEEISFLKSGAILLGVSQPLYHLDMIRDWAAKGVNSFSLDMIPRNTRAQSMDVLSSQANIAGYKAVLLAAGSFPRYFPMFMTAAGSIPPAKVLILGAGVAGLQAIATARRLGAVVEVFDTRPAVKEEVMSLGAKFIEVKGAADASKAGGYAVEQSAEFLQKQTQKIGEAIAKADVVITTAQIPGKKAPVLITQPMLEQMKNGSVVIDLAAATGGNTELTKNDQTVTFNGVRIIGNSNLAASMPYDASKLYGKNITNFLQLMIDKEGKLNVNFADDLIKGTCLTYEGKIVNEKLK